MKQAEETLADAEAMAKGELSPRAIVNRSYYAMFYAEYSKRPSYRN
jgi:uncharacterized protein (UPF0332 family)